jgi:glycosyltransferase involved in cell wall biosynthesis
MTAVRLGLVLDGPIAFDGTDYWTNLPMGRYCERLSRVFGQIDIYAPLLDQESLGHLPNMEFKIRSDCAKIIALPDGGGSLLHEIVRQTRLFSLYGEHFARNDWIVFMGATSYRLAGLVESRMRGRAYSLYFASEWKENAPFTYRFGATSGPGYFLYVKYGQFAEWLGLGGSRFALTAGSALQAKVAKSGVPTINTSPRMNLRIEDCFEREDTCQGETITCLFTGGLILRKGLSYLIEAIAALRKKGLPIELRLAGEGEQRVELEDLVRELGLEDAIEFLGHVTNGSALWDQYRSADIFVLPTLAEGFPRVLYEAMSQSLPIVTTNVSGIPYLMRDRENALVIEPEDTLALIAAIEAVATQPELRKRLIAEGMGVVRPVLETDPGEQLMQLIQEHRD